MKNVRAKHVCREVGFQALELDPEWKIKDPKDLAPYVDFDNMFVEQYYTLFKNIGRGTKKLPEKLNASAKSTLAYIKKEYMLRSYVFVSLTNLLGGKSRRQTPQATIPCFALVLTCAK